jgi:hypothetical protein
MDFELSTLSVVADRSCPMPPTVILDDTLRAAMARTAEQAMRARPAATAWIRKPPVLPSVPLRARRAPRLQVLGPGRSVCRRAVGMQLPLFDPE